MRNRYVSITVVTIQGRVWNFVNFCTKTGEIWIWLPNVLANRTRQAAREAVSVCRSIPYLNCRKTHLDQVIRITWRGNKESWRCDRCERSRVFCGFWILTKGTICIQRRRTRTIFCFHLSSHLVRNSCINVTWQLISKKWRHFRVRFRPV